MLRMRGAMQALVVVLAIFIVGCGGGQTGLVSGGPASLLLDEDDLPPGTVKAEALPEPCSPLIVLEGQNARIAVTPLYNLGSRYVGEVVGVAPSETEAAAAVKRLLAPERLSCIKVTIESFGPREGVGVTVGKPEPVADGEEGSMVRLLEVDEQSNPVNVTTIVSFRSGRCVATLLFLLGGGGPETAFIGNLTSRAHGVLADADGACR